MFRISPEVGFFRKDIKLINWPVCSPELGVCLPQETYSDATTYSTTWELIKALQRKRVGHVTVTTRQLVN